MAKRLSLFAGSGGLVPAAVAAARDAGYRVQVLSLTPRDDLGDVKVVMANVAEPLKILWAVKVFGTTHILMAGAIQLSDRTREALAAFATRGSGAQPATSVGDQTLTYLAGTLEKMTGARVVGVHEIAPGLLAEDGHIGGPEADGAVLADADAALAVALEVGRLDLGQAVVVAGRRVVAVEDIGGTDELLERVARHRAAGRIGDGSSRLTLAKARKPGQPAFADLPAIGPDTIRNAQAAGITLIALHAGNALVIERQAMAAAALEAGITVVGRPVPGD